ncbi:GNAT family N-acetyltransferase [Desulfosporosinus sp. FKA]|uniref:GNAT family N-acetyltransferase n=1 Tax=Desulfosporosinus sp. FKA TaxID=1969834 RepID=UPI000B49EA0C|nr:GNAT family N-acetyltransferase [Desulfosporosinus sp. FKA]
MHEMRLAEIGEEKQQKEIWKLCFGDPERYINFFFAHRYKADETAVLLNDRQILAMLTMMPVKTVISEHCSYSTAMLYAIATVPEYQNQGLASKLIDYSCQYLKPSKAEVFVLVPASLKLFDFYRKLGFRNGFYIKETQLNYSSVAALPVYQQGECRIYPITPEDYNRRRNHQLQGSSYISYSDEDIVYQKKLSQLSGADIYAIDIEKIAGCLAVERLSPQKVLIKEILIPADLMVPAIKQIVQEIPADEYVLRTHPRFGKYLEGIVRPFGMIKAPEEFEGTNSQENFGYLGLAFD